MIECLSMINNNLIRRLVETFFRCFVLFPTVTHKIMVKLEDLLGTFRSFLPFWMFGRSSARETLMKEILLRGRKDRSLNG